MKIKPISIVAFIFALIALLLVLLGFSLPRWFVLLRSGGEIQHWHGLWHQRRCSPRGCGEISTYTRIEGGKEFFFISKVFETLALLLVLLGFGTHLLYAFWRKPLVRQVAIYALCGAGLFGLLATLIFVAKYSNMEEFKGQAVGLGVCFPLALVGAIVCLVASAFTAWATYKKANFDDDEEDCKEITHELNEVDLDKISILDKKKLDDPTQLILMLEVTDLVGIISLLYGMLLHSAVPWRPDMAPCELSVQTLTITVSDGACRTTWRCWPSVCCSGLRMLNHMALLNLSMLLRALGEEGMWLEFRHMASYLILYSSHHLCEGLLHMASYLILYSSHHLCEGLLHMASYLILYSSHHLCEDLLHQVILCLGYFTLIHPDNQVVLQQLCSLPFQYFSDPRLTAVLFPALISCCYSNHSNRHILQWELRCVLLANFIEVPGRKRVVRKETGIAVDSTQATRVERPNSRRMNSRLCLFLARQSFHHTTTRHVTSTLEWTAAETGSATVGNCQIDVAALAMSTFLSAMPACDVNCRVCVRERLHHFRLCHTTLPSFIHCVKRCSPVSN
ncbi:hypothetical protein ACOMHN_001520 [Nucella lapillus]